MLYFYSYEGLKQDAVIAKGYGSVEVSERPKNCEDFNEMVEKVSNNILKEHKECDRIIFVTFNSL